MRMARSMSNINSEVWINSDFSCVIFPSEMEIPVILTSRRSQITPIYLENDPQGEISHASWNSYESYIPDITCDILNKVYVLLRSCIAEKCVHNYYTQYSMLQIPLHWWDTPRNCTFYPAEAAVPQNLKCRVLQLSFQGQRDPDLNKTIAIFG